MDTGVISLAELEVYGYSRADIERLIREGRLRRIARGWFATETANPMHVEVARTGGRIGCLTGCAMHGIWTPATGAPHVILGRNRPPMAEAVVHRSRQALPDTLVAPAEDCLAQVIRHHSAEEALMVLESAANSGIVRYSTVRDIIDGATVDQRHDLRHFDPRSESGSETRVRLFLQQHRFAVEPQVVIPGVGRVDMLVGRSHVLECDSKAHHSGPDAQERDRRRDLALAALGYSYTRLSYGQVHHEWERTKEFLLRLFRTRRQRIDPRPLR